MACCYFFFFFLTVVSCKKRLPVVHAESSQAKHTSKRTLNWVNYTGSTLYECYCKWVLSRPKMAAVWIHIFTSLRGLFILSLWCRIHRRRKRRVYIDQRQAIHLNKERLVCHIRVRGCFVYSTQNTSPPPKFSAEFPHTNEKRVNARWHSNFCPG